MNWQYKLIIIAVILAIISCKKKDEDLIELQPNNQVEAIFIDDFSIDAYTVRLDTTLSGNFNNSRHLVGVFNDPEIGKTIASAYTELLLPENDLDFNISENSFTSVELHLESDYNYGDDEDCKVLVNKVTSSLDQTNEFYIYSNSVVGENIGSFTINPSKSINTKTIFPLNNSFGSSIFNSPTSNLENQENFRSFLSGITLQSQSGNCIIGIDPTKSFVRVNFMTDSGTSSKDFYLNNNYYNRIVSDDYSTNLNSLSFDRAELISTETNNKVYAQASKKLNIKLNSADLKAFLDRKNISIYRAELEIVAEENPDYPNPDFLYLLSTDVENNQINNSLFFVNNGGNFVALTNGKYTFNITDYIQKNVVDVVDLLDFMISVSPIGNSIDRLIIENPSDKIKIKIYYTEL